MLSRNLTCGCARAGRGAWEDTGERQVRNRHDLGARPLVVARLDGRLRELGAQAAGRLRRRKPVAVAAGQRPRQQQPSSLAASANGKAKGNMLSPGQEVIDAAAHA